MTFIALHPDGLPFEKTYGVRPLTAKYLAALNCSKEQLEQLMEPATSLQTSHCVSVQAFCARILQAKEKNEKVFIGGDYDADGICATAIMKDTLDRLKISNGYYIPDRFKEGYGLSAATVELAAKKGYTLLITVDNGVKAKEAIEKAQELGIDILVTDHHEIEEAYPWTLLVHPSNMEDCFSNLSGAGVAFELSRVLCGDIPKLLALAAIATIGDVMPYWKENRAIISLGLQALAQNACPAARTLYGEDPITESTVAFQIVPKLNAVGRMQDASNANTLVSFLLEERPEVLQPYVSSLEQVNQKRKDLSSQMASEAMRDLPETNFLVLYQPEFQEGLCGLVAGRIAAQEHKPCLILAGEGDTIKGSGRSVPGFGLFDFFANGFEELTAFGGHAMAVGLSMKKEDFPKFAQKVQEKMESMHFTYEAPESYAIEVLPEEISFDACTDFQRLSPIPKDLLPPIFGISHPKIVSVFEKGKVKKYTVQVGTQTMDAVIYTSKNLPNVPQVKWLAGRLSIHRWRNKVSVQMDVEDIA